MLVYILRRILYAIPTIFLVTVLVFSIIHIIPGDPVEIMYGMVGTKEQIETVRSQLQLDKPIVVQYYVWMTRMVRGDFGYSLRSGDELWPILKDKFKITIILSITALTISILISILLGVFSAYKRNTIYDFATMSFAVLGLSTPIFWTGLLAIYLFSVYLNVLPSLGYVSFIKDPVEALKHLILPAFTLAFYLIAYTTKMLRSQMIDVLNQDYIMTARAKGVLEKNVIFKHALKNALIPVVTAVGLQLGFLFGGSVLIEQVFAWPGIGRFLLFSVLNRDYTSVQAVVLIVTTFFVFINLIVDIIYAFLNPKIRYK